MAEAIARRHTTKRQRKANMTTSEVMTIVIGFHMSHYRDFKNYYRAQVKLYPFPSGDCPFCAYSTTLKGEPVGIEFIDSTSIKGVSQYSYSKA